MAPLVELAVVGQMDLGDDAEQPAAMDRERRVVQSAALADRCADQQQGHQLARACHQLVHRSRDGIEQSVLKQQIVDGVGRKGELGKDRHRHRLVVALPRGREDGGQVCRRVGQGCRRRARRYAREALAIERVEAHARMPTFSGSGVADPIGRALVRSPPGLCSTGEAEKC